MVNRYTVQPKHTWKLMKDKYVVLRNFIPKDINNICLDAWKTIEHNKKWDTALFNREVDITQNSPKDSLNKSKANYCTPMAVGLHRWLHDALDDVIDMDLRETYSYSRKYERGAYLRAHTDRPSCEISATVCLDYDTDDKAPWKIWVQNDENYVDNQDMEEAFRISQGLKHRDRKGIPISLEPGDVLLYQGPNVIHWRDYLLGDYSYHMFLHFFNYEGKLGDINEFWPDNLDIDDHQALTFDGRPNRYADENDDEQVGQTKEAFRKFADVYHNQINKKSRYANNYEDFQLVVKKERKKRDDSI